MTDDHNPSIEHEPHIDPSPKRPDPSEAKAERILSKRPDDTEKLAQTGQSVFDEPNIHSAADHETIQQLREAKIDREKVNKEVYIDLDSI